MSGGVGAAGRGGGAVCVGVAGAKGGKGLWRFVADEVTEHAATWQWLYVMPWDAKFAYWCRMNPEESHLVIDAGTGKLARTQSRRRLSPTTRKRCVERRALDNDSPNESFLSFDQRLRKARLY